jgi:hypothetical protein
VTLQPADYYGISDTVPPAPGGPGPATGTAGAAEGSGGPTSWPAAVMDAMVQLARGTRAVALSASTFPAFLRFHAEWAAGASAGARKVDKKAL